MGFRFDRLAAGFHHRFRRNERIGRSIRRLLHTDRRRVHGEFGDLDRCKRHLHLRGQSATQLTDGNTRVVCNEFKDFRRHRPADKIKILRIQGGAEPLYLCLQLVLLRRQKIARQSGM
ncbi:hypothetical protein D3C71_1766720 [compost metagenome]